MREAPSSLSCKPLQSGALSMAFLRNRQMPADCLRYIETEV